MLLPTHDSKNSPLRLSMPVKPLRRTGFPAIVFSYMRFVSSRRGPWHSLVAVIGIVCVALVLLTGVLAITHFHANGQIDHDCALCFTAHQVVKIAVFLIILLASQPVARLNRERFAPLPRQRFVLKLANRPPPEEPAFV